MMKQMNKNIFKIFLRDTIEEIIQGKGLARGKFYFKIFPVAEPDKPLLTNDEDEVMRYVF